MATCEFRTVVAADALGQSSLGSDAVQHTRDARTREAGIDIEPQTLARIGIENAQHTDRAAARQNIAGKI